MIPAGAVSLAAVVAVASACSGRGDLDGERRKLPGLAERGEALEVAGADANVAFDFYDNRAAASVHRGGALEVDCASVDFAKYIEGGYRSPWHLGAMAGGVPAALVNGLAGELYVPLDRAAGGASRRSDGSMVIAFEVQPAADNQLVSVFLNETKLGDVAVRERGWKRYQLTAPADVVLDGENKLRFYFRHAGEIAGVRTAAAFRRIWFGGAGEKEAGFAATRTVRGQLAADALSLDGPGRLSFYMRVPAEAPVLAFAAGGAGAEVSVAITSGDRADHTATVWQGVANDAWQEARVGLDEYAGDVVRVDFLGQGPVQWARPQIVVGARGVGEPSTPRPRARHVIVWVVSALRADHAGAAVPTPAFDRFASRAQRYSRAVSAAAAPGPAHVAIITGTRPEAAEVEAGAKTLGERFREAGYATALVSGNGFVNDDAGFARGFDVYTNPMRLRQPFRARFLWQKGRRFLADRKDDRTLLYMATVEPHLPYTPSAESLAQTWSGGDAARFSPAETAGLSQKVAQGTERLTAEEKRYLAALYAAEVRDADLAFGQMLADLDKLGVAGDTAVILVADHGEELFERGGFGHGGHLHDEVLAVPLMVRLPGGAAGRVIDGPVSTIDVYATALDLAGIAVNPEAQGQSVLAPDALDPERPLWSIAPNHSRALRVGKHKLIVPLRGAATLYDVGADPGERTDLMGARPLVERYLRNAFGIGVAFRRAWNPARWGTATNVKAAFAADHGL